MKRNMIMNRCSNGSISYRLTPLFPILRRYDLGRGEIRIALIDCFTTLALKHSLSETSQDMHHSAENKTADEMAAGRRLSGTPAPFSQ
jgi:hypothetical protein